MKKILLLLVFLLTFSQAHECDNKRFSLSAYQNKGSALSLMDLLRDVAQTCNISVVFEDHRAKERLSQPLDMVNISDYTVPELFAFIFDDHNLFYTYDEAKGVIRVSYTKTVNFNVDYINMRELTTTSSKSITVGPGSSGSSMGGGVGGMPGGSPMGGLPSAMPGGVGSSGTGMQGSGSNTDYTNVKAISTFTFWDQLHDHIQQILEVDDEYNAALNKTLVSRDATVVTVSGTKRQIDSVKGYLNKLETRMHSQVMIEAYLIELTYNDFNTTGVNWSNFSLSLAGNYANSYNNMGIAHPAYTFGVNFDPMGLIDFLNRYGHVEVLSNPKVLTLSNQPAVINVGKQLSYLYTNGTIAAANSLSLATTTNTLGSVFVGLTLNIIPEVTEDGYIVMRINPVSSELLGEDVNASNFDGSNVISADRTMPPDTRIKQMTSIVKVKDSQKVLIGGLIEKKTSHKDSKVPILGDIPYFGRLFHGSTVSTQKSELFILITPTLIKKDIFPSIDDAIINRAN
ncbi:type II secretion system protein GspD [Sulfuricurvum sp.]|jgi:general secretion pathway protein D|uniref:type II secretion system protein GspD n=1 Tax=Sulfuricurvum sp. TaxID=2025608 RepID=UPI003564EAB0